jgi:D-arabinose 1-dehydrogenase-like Zn-dependent alcohol dehydrogenase
MRAMVLAAQAPVEASPLSPVDRPVPEPGPGEVLLRVRACGACRTDIHVVEGDLPARHLPLIPGHQVVGTVDSLGPGAARFRVGDRVGIAWLRSACGRCRFCLSGRENLCADSTYTGWTHDGGYAEYACVPEAFAYAIPSVFDDAEAAPAIIGGGWSVLATAVLLYRPSLTTRLDPAVLASLILIVNSSHFAASTVRLYSRPGALRELPFLTMAFPWSRCWG